MKFSRAFFPQSIRSRLAFYFALTFGVTLVLTSALCFQIFVQTHQENFDASLYNHAIDVASAIDFGFYGRIEVPFSRLDFQKHVPFSLGGSYLELRDPGGKYLAISANLNPKYQLPFSDHIRNRVLTVGVDYTTFKAAEIGENNGIEYRLISYLVNKPGTFPLILQIAVPMTIIQENQQAFFLLLLFIIPTGIALATFLALWASRSAFSPVRLMTEQTAQIEVKNLKDRIQVIESDQELRELGKTLNLLLDRVESSVLAQDRFVADASHQLKTPLAIIQGELELLSGQFKDSSTSPEHRESLESIRQEVSQLIRLVENLLLLARMDAGYGTVPFQTIRLDEILTEAVKRYQRIAETNGSKILFEMRPNPSHTDAEIDFEFLGDAYLLRCLVENILDNAIKYSKQTRGEILVHLGEFSDRFILEVKDQGMGISEEENQELFQRFHRDAKKSIQVQGAGLGLVIVKRIAELHRGVIRLTSEKGKGTSVFVELRKS